ncbi:MAG: ribose 5-phosphate isomerase B [Anaerolineae bacterium]|nr:ribose 5-phosphate isomerase B [Thermoflexales bacterium]MDW8407760.1 ribose 5-phosphate isomerase B [Anaerolineae bacterium]
MVVAVGADHGGYALKVLVVEQLRREGHQVIDVGAFNEERSDYPDFARLVGRALQEGHAERGILICGSGVGACIAANKMRGIRASVCHDTYSARQGVEHDAMNVLVLGGRIIGYELAFELTRAFLGAQFNQVERYIARLKKVEALETERCL